MTQKNRSKSLVCYSDMHVGARSSVCTNDPEEPSYKPNKFQKTLFQIWNETIDELTQKPRVKLINGEPFNGPNQKSTGRGQWTTSMAVQSREAEKLIRLIPGDETLFVQGSQYHVDEGGTSFEEMLADKLHAKKYSTWYEPNYAEDFLQLRMNGKLFNITHHVGFARWAAYRTTSLAREMASMHFMKEQLGNIDVMIRSHVHYFVHVEFTHTHGFTNPAWKYPDKHLFRGGMGGIIPDVGCTEVIVESNGKVLIEKHIATIKEKPQILEF
jgi:hypothetical protein